MQIALITPTSMLNNLCVTLKYQMCLAHRVLADEKYAQFYSECSDRGQYVMMDNSLWELGSSMSVEDLVTACDIAGPSELTVPDVFRDGPATIELFQHFITAPTTALIQGPADDVRCEFMVVAHGKDRREWLECFDYFNANGSLHTIALPKVLDKIWTPGGRIGCVEFLEATGRVNPEKEYHCLGIWDDPIEVLLLAQHPWIRSLDTALPIHAGMQGIKFHRDLGTSRRRPKRPHVYFEAKREDYEVDERWGIISHNIILMNEWANGNSSKGW